jgi:hypothetical protein
MSIWISATQKFEDNALLSLDPIRLVRMVDKIGRLWRPLAKDSTPSGLSGLVKQIGGLRVCASL